MGKVIAAYAALWLAAAAVTIGFWVGLVYCIWHFALGK